MATEKCWLMEPKSGIKEFWGWHSRQLTIFIWTEQSQIQSESFEAE